ncbi:winged helix DNA-binding domain-containing protein [Sanguibacter sp. 25GB23B1]|uniref:winged helix DNA-binding domain-containing protein n=1 Tax=unclassified Sanguibacter TaxID=2645534 RepID=UPI0032AEC537
MTAEGAPPGCTERELGRALLARQHLLAPAEPAVDPGTDVLRVITHLVGLQSQAPDPPYVGLWTRLRGFDPQTLGSLLLERRVVRLALLRGTIHLVAAEDALVLHALLAPLFAAQLRSNTQHGKHLAPLDSSELAAAGRAALADGPLSPADLGEVLARRWPGVPPASLAHGVRGLLPLVQVPPRGLWRARGPGTGTRWTTAESWLGRDVPVLDDPAERQAALATLVLRYLAAFGPATVADVQRWSGLTGLGRVVASIRPLLVAFTGPDGREHLDVLDGPRPAADECAPVRFLPEWDNLLLGHARRERVITEERRRAMFTANGIVHASVLVDGAVVGRWAVRTAPGSATLEVHLLDARLSTAQRAEAEAEGVRLLGLVADPASEHRVVIA